MFVIFLLLLIPVHSFSLRHSSTLHPTRFACTNHISSLKLPRSPPSSSTTLFANKSNESSTIDDSTLGIAGLLTSTIMLYSESVLFRTGCGLPAGPYGLIGAVEGVSYLGTTLLVGYSIYTKIKSGSGLPVGPYGVLGAAEGLAYAALLAGLVVLISRVVNYGYIPNAVPMEGGMCQ